MPGMYKALGLSPVYSTVGWTGGRKLRGIIGRKEKKEVGEGTEVMMSSC